MIIYRREHRVLVQGSYRKAGYVLGREDDRVRHAASSAGVNPKRAGESHIGLPVFASAKDGHGVRPFDTAVMFIPPAMARMQRSTQSAPVQSPW